MSNINIKATNNTNLPQEVEILNTIPNPNSANNSNYLYEWDTTVQDFVGINSVSIEIANTSNTNFVTYTVPVLTQSIQGVVDALNTLNQGYFAYDGNIIYVPASYYIYSTLDIVTPIPPTTLFTSLWNTLNTSGGSSASNQVQLPLESSGTYNFTVDWGDGNSDTITTWNQAETLHTYASSGTYTITISGTCTGWRFNNTGDRLKITSISSWGNLNLGNSAGYFYGCANLTLNAVNDILDLTGTTNFSNFYNGCTSLTAINNVSSWNTGSVTNMSYMFSGASVFNQSIDSWNVSSVTNMEGMFRTTTSFNEPIGSWNVSSVTNMLQMFFSSTSFNQSIASWNVSSVINMAFMFEQATAFNQNIGSWNISSATDISSMFRSATSFNQNIGSWDVSSVTSLTDMFRDATAFNQPIGSWDVSSVLSMSGMFNGATAFNQNIGAWDVSNVNNLTNFMAGKSSANYSSTNLDAIYNGWSALTVQPNVTANFGTIQYTGAGSAGKAILDNAPNNWTITDGGLVALSFISVWNTANTSIGSSTSTQVQLPLDSSGTYNFTVNWGDGTNDTITTWNQAQTLHTYATSGIYNIRIDGICEGWRFNNTGDRLKITSVTDWGDLKLGNSSAYFYGCANLTLNAVSDILDLTGTFVFDNFFNGCTSLTTINNVGSWDTSSVTDMSGVFLGASAFNQSINSWDTSSVGVMSAMFFGASLFNQPLNSWDVSNVTNMNSMFNGATAFNQDISSWDVSSVSGMSGFMSGKSTLNYSISYLNAIYNSWSLLTLQPTVTVSFGSIQYTSSGTAGKAILIGAPNNWAITDGGITAGSSIFAPTGSQPAPIVMDSIGNIYVGVNSTDSIVKITVSGVVTTFATFTDASTGLAIDSSNNIYSINNLQTIITKITPSGVTSTFGTVDNTSSCIGLDTAGNVYTADGTFDRVIKTTQAGVSTTLGTTGNDPNSIIIDSAGNVYTANSSSNNVSKITSGGVSSILGTTGTNPIGITIDSSGNIYTSNQVSNNVSKITSGGVSTILGTTGTNPRGIVIDSAGNIYTANSGSDDVSKITPSGVSTIVGTTGTFPNYMVTGFGYIYTTNTLSSNVSRIVI